MHRSRSAISIRKFDSRRRPVARKKWVDRRSAKSDRRGSRKLKRASIQKSTSAGTNSRVPTLKKGEGKIIRTYQCPNSYPTTRSQHGITSITFGDERKIVSHPSITQRKMFQPGIAGIEPFDCELPHANMGTNWSTWVKRFELFSLAASINDETD